MANSTKTRKSSVKDAVKAGVRPKKTTTKKDAALKEIATSSDEVAVTLAPEKESPVKKAIKAVKAAKSAPASKVQDVVSTLPEHKQGTYVRAKSVGETKTIQVNINDITATSQSVYVTDIHAANPQVLATVYWIIMPNTSNVVLRVTKEDYENLMKRKEAQSMSHLYSVVDNSVFPSLTYGSWKLKEIKGFPTAEQIDEYDAKFRTMEVYLHNQPVIAAIQQKQEEEDEFEIDFYDDDDEGDAIEEEDEFDFEEAN